MYKTAVTQSSYPISNNIGIGILSYNRLGSLQRLIQSIRANSNLLRTTVFVSDESTDGSVKDWLKDQDDIVFVDNVTRLGVAGNSNRLLRCLSRFEHKFILNDDVEILKSGWESFYINAMNTTGLHHFCFRQPGVYGATVDDGNQQAINGVQIKTIHAKPQGSILVLDRVAFETVGYFDEKFKIYGMEHVDWSLRLSRSRIQTDGYHDVAGSEQYFKIWDEKSAVDDRSTHLAEARQLFSQLSADFNRIYVNPTAASNVPSVSYVIPVRNVDRTDSLKAVIANIRGQRFPNININVIEQDSNPLVPNKSFEPCKYKFVEAPPGQHFNKALAFNVGVSQVEDGAVVLHDADILVPANYTSRIYKILETNESCHLGAQVLYLDATSSKDVCTRTIIDDTKKCESIVDYFEGGSVGIRKSVYIQIGGFDENFVGYGMEDLEFYERIKRLTGFVEDRTIKFIHLWHSRVSGWNDRHIINKNYFADIQTEHTVRSRSTLLRDLLSKRYGL